MCFFVVNGVDIYFLSSKCCYTTSAFEFCYYLLLIKLEKISCNKEVRL